MRKIPDALVLFSGGLDSLLAARLLAQQGLSILCLHFYSPFFGNPEKVGHWRECYGLEIEAVDVSVPFVTMLANTPQHGTGKTLNPCVDCKILLLEHAHRRMIATGAKFVATGEVLGQRPMSQRRDAFNTISKESKTRDILLRPLSALLLPPTQMEESGLVQREKLLGISGRGRNSQLRLASAMGIDEVPTPAGGCRLTEQESCRRYWPLLERHTLLGSAIPELVADFQLANTGRMLIHQDRKHWLVIGKNEADNKRINTRRAPLDEIAKLPFPGPLGLLRLGATWPEELQAQACAILASYSPRAAQEGEIAVKCGGREFRVRPCRNEGQWGLPAWDQVHEQIRAQRREKAMERQRRFSSSERHAG